MVVVPEIQFAQKDMPDGKSLVGISGWEQVEKWAMRNDPAFCHGCRLSEHMGLSEPDRMKVVTRMLLNKVCIMDKALSYYTRTYGAVPPDVI